MKQVYDLTTQSGIDKALMVLEGLNNPLSMALKFLKDLLSSNDPEKQAEVVKELIESGRRQGVDEMEITLENHKGFKLDIPLEDVKINSSLGSDGKIHLKVKFQKDEPIRPLLETPSNSSNQKSSALSNKTTLLAAVLVILLIIICVLVCYILFSKQ